MFNLENTDNLFSIILAILTISSLLFRKIISPCLKKLFSLIKSIILLPKRVGLIELALSDNILTFIKKETILSHNISHTNNFKINLLLDNLSVPLYECSAKGDCIWTNKALQNLFGVSEGDILNFGWLDSLHPDDIVKTKTKWMEAVNNWTPYKARYRVINKVTNETIYCETSADIILDENNKILSIFGTVKPLTKNDYFN